MIGSIPRTDELFNAKIQYESDLLTSEELRQIEHRAVEQTIKELDQHTGSLVLTDGEQTKSSFLTYPIYDLVYEFYKFDEKCFQITFSDGLTIKKDFDIALNMFVSFSRSRSNFTSTCQSTISLCNIRT